MIDFRLVENRRELLIRYAVWQLRRSDVDTAIPVMNYIFDRNEFNIEQKYWFCFLYGNTYDVASALVLWSEMPDLHLVTPEKLNKLSENCANNKIHYQNDVKWAKRHLFSIVQPYISNMTKAGGSHNYFKNICCSNDPIENYFKLRNEIFTHFYKFGRYVAFFYMQALKSCCGLNIDAPEMHLGNNCASPTDGLLYALGREKEASRLYVEDGRKTIKQSTNWSKEVIKGLNKEAESIIEEVNNRFSDIRLDYFLFETILCSYKKLFRRKNGRYLGYYLSRLNEDVSKAEKYWKGVDFNIVRDWMKETYPDCDYVTDKKPDNLRMQKFLDTGTLPELNMYLDLQNF